MYDIVKKQSCKTKLMQNDCLCKQLKITDKEYNNKSWNKINGYINISISMKAELT